MVYEVRFTPEVNHKLRSIKNYIAIHFSESAANKKVNDIIKSLAVLEVFPDGGFNADERYGKKFDTRFLTRGLTLKRDYIALYFVDEKNKTVVVTHLSSTKEDPIKIFK